MGENSSDEDELEFDLTNQQERKTLLIVLAINLSQVALAGTVGLIAKSTGLLGAALDNLADAGVYIVSLYAVGRSQNAKAAVAKLSGSLLIILGLLLLAEVIRRFITGSEPVGLAIVITAVVNAASNFVCLKLMRKHTKSGAHMKASEIFTANDMLVNLGVVLSGIALMIFDSPIPDLFIGLVISAISIKGGVEILRESRRSLQQSYDGDARVGTKN